MNLFRVATSRDAGEGAKRPPGRGGGWAGALYRAASPAELALCRDPRAGRRF
ncbi:hypothetical protein OH687_05575 [Burkholderia anthina]|nr:hypothetical protein OH687_05575 [Burkholderia anthina]